MADTPTIIECDQQSRVRISLILEKTNELYNMILSNDSDIETIQTAIAGIQNHLTTIDSQITQLDQDVSDVNDRVDSNDTRISQNETDISSLENSLSAIDQRLTLVEQTTNELYNEYAKLKTRRDGNKLYMTDNGTNP